MKVKPSKAVVLLSGGLDSSLAVLVLKNLGVEVIGVHFSNGFSVAENREKIFPKKKTKHFSIDELAIVLGIKVHKIDIQKEFRDVVLNPSFGYGANVNPCIDCRILMLKKAKELLKKIGADFVATGEVLGQRPMSQRRDTLDIVERESELRGKLLRPLSAKVLRETEIEKKGLIDREKLLSITGRGRKRQIELAKEFNIEQFIAPSTGCCFLTEKRYADKFKDKMKYAKKKLEMSDFELLMVGRHFRIAPILKLIVGRNFEENSYLKKLSKDSCIFETTKVPGPVAITDEGFPDEKEEILCSSIVASYSDAKNEEEVEVEIFKGGKKAKMVKVSPLKDETILNKYRI